MYCDDMAEIELHGNDWCNNSQFQVNFYSRKFHYSLFTIHFYYSLFISEIFISYSRKLNYFNDNPRV